MVDLDAPSGSSNNSLSPLLHWLTPLPAGSTSLPGNQSQTSPQAAAPYAGPQQPPGSGRHRYVTILLSNPAMNFTWPAKWQGFNPAAIEDRFVFNVKEFVDEGGYRVLGANWFTTENITSVGDSGAGRVVGWRVGYAAVVVAGLAAGLVALL